ncbi:MAG TPA: hypothetical protein ENH29_08400 [Bacteroidetes bacterium]|nr:hypothetical protein [Bacteroidota bacterium]
MSENKDIPVLIGKVNHTLFLLNEIVSFYYQVQSNELKLLGKSQSSALIIAQIFENFYTCLETLFLRISQYFENSIQKDKRHSDLLNNMKLKIEGVRIPVLSGKSHKSLLELMRFRHFKRYYFELDYDWNKLDYLSNIFENSYDQLKEDLINFRDFLQMLHERSTADN